MKIERSNEKAMLELWGETENCMVSTTRFFYENIRTGNAEFWTWTHENRIVGELYIF